MSRLIRDDQHMTVPHLSNGHIFNPALNAIRSTRAVARWEWVRKHPLPGWENLQNWAVQLPQQQDLCSNILWAEGKRSEGAGKPSPFLRHGLVGCPILGWHSFLQERGETGVQVYQEDMRQGAIKHLNMTLFSGKEWIFQQKLADAQKVKPSQEWLQRNLLAFMSSDNWLRGVQTSKHWTINCGLFWRIQCAESVTTAWRAWRDP